MGEERSGTRSKTQPTGDGLSVCCRPSSTAANVRGDEVDLLAVLVCHRGARGRASIRAQHHAVLQNTGWQLSPPSWTPTLAVGTLNITPAMVVPVFQALGAVAPLLSSSWFRFTKLKSKPPGLDPIRSSPAYARRWWRGFPCRSPVITAVQVSCLLEKAVKGERQACAHETAHQSCVRYTGTRMGGHQQHSSIGL